MKGIPLNSSADAFRKLERQWEVNVEAREDDLLDEQWWRDQ